MADTHADLVVLGAGPGGYACAFRAADLGRKVVLVDPRATLGKKRHQLDCNPVPRSTGRPDVGGDQYGSRHAAGCPRTEYRERV